MRTHRPCHEGQGKKQAFQNRLKLGVQTRGKPASRLQALDCRPKLSESLSPLLKACMRTHWPYHPDWRKNQAFQNRLKLGLQTRGKLASRLQALDRKLKLSKSFWPLFGVRICTHELCHLAGGKNQAFQTRRKLGVQTCCKPASRLQALDRILKLFKSFWQLLGARKRTHEPCHIDWEKNKPFQKNWRFNLEFDPTITKIIKQISISK